MNTEKRTLYEHKPHEHYVRNVNRLMEIEQITGSLNQKIAISITRVMSSMPTFWLVVFWILLWIVANSTIAHFDPLPFPLLLALSSIPQLPLMAIIMIGQGLLGRKQELQSEEAFQTTLKTYHDIEQIVLHMNAQDAKMIETLDSIHILSGQIALTASQITTLQSKPTPRTTKKTEVLK